MIAEERDAFWHLLIALLIVAVAVVMAGCGHFQNRSPEWWAAHEDCKNQVVQAYGGWSRMDAGQAIMSGIDTNRCMEAKGYR